MEMQVKLYSDGITLIGVMYKTKRSGELVQRKNARYRFDSYLFR